MSDYLGSVHYDLGAVGMSHFGYSVHVVHIACYIGCCADADVFDLAFVLREKSLDIVIDHASHLVDFSIDDVAALPPGKVVRMMLHACAQNQIVFALDDSRSELVETVSGRVDIETDIFVGVCIYEIHDRLACHLIEVCRVVGLL